MHVLPSVLAPSSSLVCFASVIRFLLGCASSFSPAPHLALVQPAQKYDAHDAKRHILTAGTAGNHIHTCKCALLAKYRQQVPLAHLGQVVCVVVIWSMRSTTLLVPPLLLPDPHSAG